MFSEKLPDYNAVSTIDDEKLSNSELENSFCLRNFISSLVSLFIYFWSRSIKLSL